MSYVFLLYVYVSSSCQLALFGYPDWGFSVLFPQLYGKCQGKTRKDGARNHSSKMFVLFYVLLVLCRCVYCVCVCVWMCTVLLPPGGYPIAVNKYITSSETSLTMCSVNPIDFVHVMWSCTLLLQVVFCIAFSCLSLCPIPLVQITQ